MKASKEENPLQTENHQSYSCKNELALDIQCQTMFLYIDRLLRMCQIKPKWLLEAKIGSYKLYDKSFLSLILKSEWVSDDVSL